MRRLSLQIYTTFLGILLLFGGLVTAAWLLIPMRPQEHLLIRNLLENARRYAAGAPVEASVGPLHPTGARLCIADRGPGVLDQERERIFAPFYRPASMRERGDDGVGLGLALVRQTARHHGGDVRCAPRAGGGTCFEMTLCPAPGKAGV